MKRDYLIIVTGLPRSGTSLLMQMLGAGGIPLLYDSERLPDEFNPYGYYEYKPINNLTKPSDIFWLQQYKGYAVKIVSPILVKLTIPFPSRIIYIKRDLQEVIASQQRMAYKNNFLNISSVLLDQKKLLNIFKKHTQQMMKSILHNPNLKLLEVTFYEIFANSENIIHSIDEFLDGDLDKNKMKSVIKPELYRNKVKN